MYQQYRNIDGNINLITVSGRPDEVNEKILNGDYSKQSRENIKLIFSEWQEGDILYLANTILENPVLDKNRLREKTKYELYIEKKYTLQSNEAVIDKEIKTLSEGQYVIEGGVKTKDKPEGVQIEWDWETKEWVEKGTIDMVKFEIDSLKTKILEEGFKWNGYRQKCRDKDIALINSTLEALNYAVQINPDEKVTWYFNDSTSLVMGTTELTDLRQKGFKFMQGVYDVENRYKKGGIQKHTLEQYRLDVEALINK